MKSGSRVHAVEIIKGAGVLCMIFLHIFVWRFINDDYGSSVIERDFWQAGLFLKLLSLFSIIIPITAGFSFHYYLKKNNNKNHPFKIMTRILSLLVLGYAINIIVYGFSDYYSWDVLQYIALSFFILFGLSFFPAYVTTIFAVASLIISMMVGGLYNNSNNYLLSILIGDSTGLNYWPLIPWFVFPAAGFLAARAYEKGMFKKKNISYSIFALSCFIVVLSVFRGEFLVSEDVSNFWGPSIFAPPLSRVLANISIFFILLLLAEWHCVQLPKYSIFNSLSKGIIYIYFLHLVLGFRLVNYMKMYGFTELRFTALAAIFILGISYLVGCGLIILKEKGVRIFP